MVISNEERAVLLKRLEKAREAKVKKQQEAKDAKESKAPAPAPVVAPPPVDLEPIEEVDEAEIALPPKVVPVKAPKKAKKVVVPEPSDSSDNEEKPVVIKKKALKDNKKQPYMKLKLYREPTNPVAFQSLLENLNAEYEDEESVAQPQQPQAFARPPRVLAHSGAKPETKSKINDARALAMSFFN